MTKLIKFGIWYLFLGGNIGCALGNIVFFIRGDGGLVLVGVVFHLALAGYLYTFRPHYD